MKANAVRHTRFWTWFTTFDYQRMQERCYARKQWFSDLFAERNKSQNLVREPRPHYRNFNTSQLTRFVL